MKSVPQIPIDNSPIVSDQTGPASGLSALVRKHLTHPWQKPVPEHTRRAADEALEWLQALGNPPLILDSFCGTGLSTSNLARSHPQAAVIGIDKSAARLGRHQKTDGNYLLVRAECEPFWAYLVAARVTLEQHYLLYPNPWPKSGQLKRRIHGHPGFPLLAALGGAIELRSNWNIYVQEFALACNLIDIHGALETLTPEAPITLFERKYHERGQSLWRFRGLRA